ncbi:MAG: hypothetical protein KF749_10115 [Bacteroidetes bacterium]|nr:hypothetical protein [Bacteroidota bacterium]MCW5896682.1 hypothetical protein [Bacteroidota bacterium]
MKHENIITELEDVARQLGVTIRYEKGDFEGGFCILKDNKILLINKKLVPNRKAAVLAVAMQEIGLENVFMKPALREYIEDEVARASRAMKQGQVSAR